MDNIELQKKVEEIISIENFFDMIEAVVNFEGEYKKTSFYKKTKMSLADVIKNYKILNIISLESLTTNIQKLINNINLDNVMSVINQLGDVFENENSEIREEVKNLEESFGSILKK